MIVEVSRQRDALHGNGDSGGAATGWGQTGQAQGPCASRSMSTLSGGLEGGKCQDRPPYRPPFSLVSVTVPLTPAALNRATADGGIRLAHAMRLAPLWMTTESALIRNPFEIPIEPSCTTARARPVLSGTSGPNLPDMSPSSHVVSGALALHAYALLGGVLMLWAWPRTWRAHLAGRMEISERAAQGRGHAQTLGLTRSGHSGHPRWHSRTGWRWPSRADATAAGREIRRGLAGPGRPPCRR